MTLQHYATFHARVVATHNGDQLVRAGILKMVGDLAGHRSHRVVVAEDAPASLDLDWRYGPVHGAWESDIVGAVQRWAARNPSQPAFTCTVLKRNDSRQELACPTHGDLCAVDNTEAKRQRVAQRARQGLIDPVTDDDLVQVWYDLAMYLGQPVGPVVAPPVPW